MHASTRVQKNGTRVQNPHGDGTISAGSSNPLYAMLAKNQAPISSAIAPSLGAHGQDGRYTGECSTKDSRINPQAPVRHRIADKARPTSGRVNLAGTRKKSNRAKNRRRHAAMTARKNARKNA